jgi:hypothetical protein
VAAFGESSSISGAAGATVWLAFIVIGALTVASVTGELTGALSIERIIASAICLDAAVAFVTGAAVFVAVLVVEFSNAPKRFVNAGALRTVFNGKIPPSIPTESFAVIAIAFTRC